MPIELSFVMGADSQGDHVSVRAAEDRLAKKMTSSGPWRRSSRERPPRVTLNYGPRPFQDESQGASDGEDRREVRSGVVVRLLVR